MENTGTLPIRLIPGTRDRIQTIILNKYQEAILAEPEEEAVAAEE